MVSGDVRLRVKQEQVGLGRENEYYSVFGGIDSSAGGRRSERRGHD